jgi:hypothetical protein
MYWFPANTPYESVSIHPSSVLGDLKNQILLLTNAATIKKSSMTNFLAMELLTNRAATAMNAMAEVAMTMPYPRLRLPPGLEKSATTPGGGSRAGSNKIASKVAFPML